MTAASDNPALPAEIVEEMTVAGLAPTLGNLAEIIAAHRANVAKIAERAVALSEAKCSLQGLCPLHISDEVIRVAAAKGRLVAHQEQKGAPWFSTVGEVEAWLKRTGHWFRNPAAEARWRRDVKARTGKG